MKVSNKWPDVTGTFYFVQSPSKFREHIMQCPKTSIQLKMLVENQLEFCSGTRKREANECPLPHFAVAFCETCSWSSMASHNYVIRFFLVQDTQLLDTSECTTAVNTLPYLFIFPTHTEATVCQQCIFLLSHKLYSPRNIPIGQYYIYPHFLTSLSCPWGRKVTLFLTIRNLCRIITSHKGPGAWNWAQTLLKCIFYLCMQYHSFLTILFSVLSFYLKIR